MDEIGGRAGARRSQEWIEVREPGTRKLLFRYDPTRGKVEVERRGVRTVVELEKFRQGLSESFEALQRMAEAYAQVLRDFFEAVMPVLQRITRELYEFAWGEYRRAGCPYGEDEAGLMKWMGERQRIGNE